VRILTIANRLDPDGGLERTQLTNCSGLQRRGHVLDLMYVQDGAFGPRWRDITTSMTQVTTTLPRRAELLRSSHSVASALRQARRQKPDVVYAYRYWDLPFAVSVAAGSRASVVYHLCLPPPGPIPAWLRRVLARVDWTVSVSRQTLSLWEGTGLHVGRSTIALTSVDLEAFVPGNEDDRVETRGNLGFGAGDFVVFFAGRITQEKGVDVLLAAFRDVTKSVPHAKLVILGSPSVGGDPVGAQRYFDALRASASDLPVTWLAQRADVVALLQAADVAVVPSVWPEPLSRSILEAMACGVPVVTSRVGGSPELLTGWLSDFLVDPGQPVELADRLVALHHWRHRDPGLGARFRQEAESRLRPDDELDLIERAMTAAGSSSRS
jgi:glycosyltransferase involved in cell wall biosynthesis